MLRLSRVMAAILNFRSANDLQLSTGLLNDHSCKVTIQLAWWFLTRRFFKFQPMRTHYGSWKPCWILNQHQKHKSGRGPSNEISCKFGSILFSGFREEDLNVKN